VFVKDIENGCKNKMTDILDSVRGRGCKFRDFWRNSKFEVVEDSP
jgi:hypothetical protein